MCIRNTRLAEMEDRRRQHRARMPLDDASDQIAQPTNAARCHHRNAHLIGDRADQVEVVPAFRTVAVHRRDEQLARAQLGEAQRVRDRIDARRAPATMREHFPAIRHAPRIDRGHHALAAELVCQFRHQLGPLDRSGIDRDLVRPRQQQRARIRDDTHPAADRQRHEAHFRRAPHHVEDRAARLMAGGDVEEAKLVRPRRIISACLLDRIAGIAQFDEINAFHDAAVSDVEAGNDARADGHIALTPPPPRRAPP